MTTLTRADLLTEAGATWVSTILGDIKVVAWESTDPKSGARIFKASLRRGDLLRHPEMPKNLVDLDRAFEHAVQMAVEMIQARAAQTEVSS